MRECVSHHNACDCREAKYTSDMALLRAELEAVKRDRDGARRMSEILSTQMLELVGERDRFREALVEIGAESCTLGCMSGSSACPAHIAKAAFEELGAGDKNG